MKRRLRLLLLVAAAETAAVVVVFWRMDRHVSRIVDLIDAAYGAHGPVDYSTFVFPAPVRPMADRTPSKEPLE